MHPMMFVHYVEKRCEVNDKYYVLSVPGIKEKKSRFGKCKLVVVIIHKGVCHAYR